MKRRPARETGKSDGAREAAARALAVQALGFLAADDERIERFLSLAGIDAGAIRAAAGEPHFLAGVLEHVAGDERLLLDFAAAAGVKPVEIDRARAALGGIWERDIP